MEDAVVINGEIGRGGDGERLFSVFFLRVRGQGIGKTTGPGLDDLGSVGDRTPRYLDLGCHV